MSACDIASSSSSVGSDGRGGEVAREAGVGVRGVEDERGRAFVGGTLG